MFAAMGTVRDWPRTTDTCLFREDAQEGKREFDGQCVIPATGGSVAHRRITGNPWMTLPRLLAGVAHMAMPGMRLQTGNRVRYPCLEIAVPDLGGTLPLQTVYQGLTFAA